MLFLEASHLTHLQIFPDLAVASNSPPHLTKVGEGQHREDLDLPEVPQPRFIEQGHSLTSLDVSGSGMLLPLAETPTVDPGCTCVHP